MGNYGSVHRNIMTSPAPIKEPISEVSRHITRPWILWTQFVTDSLSSVSIETIRITSIDSPYTIPFPSINLV